MNKRMIASTLILIALLAAALGNSPARAADTVVGSGAPASCTEAAFDAALAAAGAGPSVIAFDCGSAAHTIYFTSPKNINAGALTIDGGGRIILDGQNAARLFFANEGVSLTLKNILLLSGNSGAGGGGAIEAFGAFITLDRATLSLNQAGTNGGAVACARAADGWLHIIDSQFEGNAAQNGGAIYNDGCTVTVTRSILYGNQASGSGGAVYNAANGDLVVAGSAIQYNNALDGAGIYNAGGATASVQASVLEYNFGGYGGGIENSGVLTVLASRINQNTVTGVGGGLWNLGGQMTLENITVSNNRAYEGGGVNSYGNHVEITNANITDNVATTSHGGGIYLSAGTMFVTNATISGNRANNPAANGGGIFHQSDGNLTLTSVTLANNQAGQLGGGLYHYGRYAVVLNATFGNNQALAGSAIYEDSPMTPAEPGVVQLGNSVIFGSANNCDGGLFESLGSNISKGTCAPLIGPGDQNNIAGSLLLSSLSFNGGAFSMNTYVPQPGSPLVNTGDPGSCPAADQRGAARVGACDIGASESGASLPRLFLPFLVQK